VGDFVVLRPARGPLIMLQFDVEMFTPGRDPLGTELAVAVNDLKTLWQRWQDFGATVARPPRDIPLGRTFVGKGPEGHQLRFYEIEDGYSLSETEVLDRTMRTLRNLFDD